MSVARGRCSVCLANFDNGVVSALLCGHTFHLGCILQWLQQSKTCPECRVKTSERLLVRQLYFHAGDNTQEDQTGILMESADLQLKVKDLESTISKVKSLHAEAMRKLMAADVVKDEAINKYKTEKGKRKSLAAQMDAQKDKILQLEMMLQNQQQLEKELEKFKQRFKASELYAVLTVGDAEQTEAKIGEYLGDSGDPHTYKFLQLMGRQVTELRKRLQSSTDTLSSIQRLNAHLSAKLNKHKKLNVAFKEEIDVLRSKEHGVPANPKLKDVIDYSPERRTSLGFAVDDQDDFSKSLVESAFRARNRPTHTVNIVPAKTNSLFSSTFDNDSMFSSSCVTESTRPHVISTSAIESVEMDVDENVKVPDVIMRRALLPPSKYKSNGMGGVVSHIPRPTNNATGTFKSQSMAAKNNRLKRNKTDNEKTTAKISTFFAKAVPKDNDDLIILE